MPRIPVHTVANAPEGSADTLKAFEAKVGKVINIFGGMAASPAVINAYAGLQSTITENATLDAPHQGGGRTARGGGQRLWLLPGRAHRCRCAGRADRGGDGPHPHRATGRTQARRAVGRRLAGHRRNRDGRTGDLGRGPGRQLEPVEHLDTFWFAWVAFQPETDVIR